MLSARTMLIDTDVAGDDLVALAFVLSSPHVEVAGITVSGTGEAHCAGGVNVMLRFLERLDAPEIPVACGRETPLAGTHAFPDGWRERVDQGSGLDLPPTTRRPSDSTAVELIELLAERHPGIVILTLGPVTNLADALLGDPGLAAHIGQVYVMGGALHVRGNILGPGAPTGNTVAEWNIYVDPHAAQEIVDSGIEPSFISLDGTNHVPVTKEFAALATDGASTPAAMVLADLFAANPFMTDGSYFLWDPLAAQLAAGYPVGSFRPAAIVVEEAEGPESGFTRPLDGSPNIQYLATADPREAEASLLDVLNGR
jgi:inosine-uridine nucleoside N-ribohydrolase